MGCGACVNMCPSFAIKLTEDANRKNLSFDLAKCTFCATCADICPTEAIKLTEEYRLIYDDRKLGQLHGCMGKERCGVCNRYWHTAEQHSFVMEALKEKNYPEEILRKAEEVLSTCTVCKEHSEYITRMKKDMAHWAMEGGEI